MHVLNSHASQPVQILPTVSPNRLVLTRVIPFHRVFTARRPSLRPGPAGSRQSEETRNLGEETRDESGWMSSRCEMEDMLFVFSTLWRKWKWKTCSICHPIGHAIRITKAWLCKAW